MVTLRFIKHTLFLAAISLLCSCETINPPEEIPSFVRIDSISVTTQYSTQGTTSSNITEGWLFVNDEFIGIYGLPALIPVLNSGDVNIKVKAGIKKNGIGFTRVDYPFYNFYETSATLIKNDTTTINPVVPYYANRSYWHEDFEDPGLKLVQLESQSDTGIVIIEEPIEDVFEGNGAGKVTLDDANNSFFILTDNEFQFPLGKPVFLELNYKTTQDFSVGVYSRQSGQSIFQASVFVRAFKNELNQPEWNKIYIDLSEVINSNSSGSFNHEVYINGIKTQDAETATFLFDNLKIVW